MVNWYGKTIVYGNNWTCHPNRYCLSFCHFFSRWAKLKSSLTLLIHCNPHYKKFKVKRKEMERKWEAKQKKKLCYDLALRLVWTQHDTTYFWYVWDLIQKVYARVKSFSRRRKTFFLNKCVYFESFVEITVSFTMFIHNTSFFSYSFCTQTTQKYHNQMENILFKFKLDEVKEFASNNFR